MTRKVYRTAQGKLVDLGSLQLRNENVRAVGNQKVNARGDVIDSNNRPIVSRNQQVAKQYRKQVTNTSDGPVVSSAREATVPLPPEDFEDDFQPPTPTKKPEGALAPEAPGQGLAAAIAKSRSIKQELEKTPRQLAQERAGVKRI